MDASQLEAIAKLPNVTGIRPLGQQLRREGALDADILFSHTHWDHVNGFPFFAPAFEPDNAFRVFAGHLAEEGGIREAIAGHMHEPMFPVPLDVMRARLSFTDFAAGETLDLGRGLQVRTAPLNHPNGATAYRIDHGGRSVCYVTDTEHVPGRPDERILGLVAGADLVVITDSHVLGVIGLIARPLTDHEGRAEEGQILGEWGNDFSQDSGATPVFLRGKCPRGIRGLHPGTAARELLHGDGNRWQAGRGVLVEMEAEA